jgi:hypothetical protein
MTNVDPDKIRAMVRRALEEKLGLVSSPSDPPNPNLPFQQHPSHLDVVSDCGDEDELSPHRSCLIEPHRMCSGSGYCKKLGY